jgi:hypothetical protein
MRWAEKESETCARVVLSDDGHVNSDTNDDLSSEMPQAFRATMTSSPLLILFNDMVMYFVYVDYLAESSEATGKKSLEQMNIEVRGEGMEKKCQREQQDSLL